MGSFFGGRLVGIHRIDGVLFPRSGVLARY